MTPPHVASGDISFPDSTEVSLASITPKSNIFYALKDQNFKEYKTPFTISDSDILRTYAVKRGVISDTVETDFTNTTQIDPSRLIMNMQMNTVLVVMMP